MSADLHGDEAEQTLPPGMISTVAILRAKGHCVSVRRSAKSGSWYYTVDQGREMRAIQVIRKYGGYGL